MDLVYMFWSISSGIICGVGLYTLAVILCIVMTFMIWVLGVIPVSKAPILLIVKAEINASNDEINNNIKRYCSYFNQCSVTIKNKQSEIVYEVHTKEKEKLTSDLSSIEGVLCVSCLEHDGEIRM
jgi:uncharacterized membrane protein YhiD involved in acid resistance